MCAQVHVHMEPSDNIVTISQVPSALFYDKSYITFGWNFPIMLGWLSREFQRSSCFCLPNAEITRAHPTPPPWSLFCVGPGDGTQVLPLSVQEVYQPSQVPSPKGVIAMCPQAHTTISTGISILIWFCRNQNGTGVCLKLLFRSNLNTCLKNTLKASQKLFLALWHCACSQLTVTESTSTTEWRFVAVVCLLLNCSLGNHMESS